MAKITCPDCGFEHDSESNLDASETKTNRISNTIMSQVMLCT